MKIFRNSTIACIAMCTLSLIFISVLLIIQHYTNNLCYLDILLNIIIGIFASSFVVLITTVIQYFISKQKTISSIIYYSGEYHIKYSRLIQYIFPLYGKKTISFNLAEFKNFVLTDKYINDMAQTLNEIFDKQHILSDDYCPFLIKSKSNLDIHRLVCYWAELNNFILHLNFIYEHSNNALCSNDDNNFNDEQLITHIKNAIENSENSSVKKFNDLFKILAEKYHSKNYLFNLNKCP